MSLKDRAAKRSMHRPFAQPMSMCSGLLIFEYHVETSTTPSLGERSILHFLSVKNLKSIEKHKPKRIRHSFWSGHSFVSLSLSFTVIERYREAIKNAI